MTRAYLGVDIGGTAIKWVVASGTTVTSSGSIPTPRSDHEAVLGSVVGIVAGMAGVDGVGVTIPGTVDTVRRESVFVPNLPGSWERLDVGARLERACGLPVTVVNDAIAFARAEQVAGAGRGCPDALYVTLGTGVGGAVCLAGELLLDERGSIGEIGHVPVDPSGEPCACGGRGCLETIASGPAILGRLARVVATGQSEALRELGGERGLSVEAAGEAARAGDRWAGEAFERAGEALGRAIATVCLVLQLRAVVVGGGLRPAADLYLPAIQRALDERVSITGPVEARTAHHGAEAGAVGAALMASATDTAHVERTPR